MTDQKPYAHHERLATRRANEGKKADAERLSAFREDLREMHAKIEGEANERRQEMFRSIRAYKNRKASSDSNLRQTLRDQSKDHQNFLGDMSERVWQMPTIWGGEPIRETKERTRARSETHKAVIQQTKDYKQMVKSLSEELATRGPQDWTAVPRASNDAIVKHRKAAGIAALTQSKESYENYLEGMEEREHTRVLGERREAKQRCREAEMRLASDKTKLMQSLSDTGALKKAELDGIQERVNRRGNGDPQHPEFSGYATAGYHAVDKSSKRLRDHAAEAADRDADHAGSAAKLLCLSMPLNLRNRIVAANHPRNKASLMGTGIESPTDWSEMNWSQRWALLSRHAPQSAVMKAEEKAGVKLQGLDLTVSAGSVAEQRTLSPRTLGLATS